jgi:deazaflavin-dependent oxidoreductase (nitroreductase family)
MPRMRRMQAFVEFRRSWDTPQMPSDRVYTRLSTTSARALKAAGKLNIPLYRASRGRLFGKIAGTPVLLLTCIGRRSGQARTAPMVYLADGERLIVIGSNAGHKNAPAWSLNLEANPDAEVELGSKRRKVRARVAKDEERADLWRKMNAQYSGFDDYSARTTRDIRLFVLEPR